LIGARVSAVDGQSEWWWLVGGGQPSLVFSLFLDEASLVDPALTPDPITTLPGAGLFASRHHQPAALARFAVSLADRDFSGGGGQDREEQCPSGFGGIGVAAGRGPLDGAIGELTVGPASDTAVERFKQMVTPTG
jgi:hypothetical protein